MDTGTHRNTLKCALEYTRYQAFLRYRAEQGSRGVTFQVVGVEIERVREFKYLERIVSDNDDDSPAIEANL